MFLGDLFQHSFVGEASNTDTDAHTHSDTCKSVSVPKRWFWRADLTLTEAAVNRIA